MGVLFRQCGSVTDKDDGPCQVPVTAIFSHSHCVFHTKLQQKVSRNNLFVTKTENENKENEIVVNNKADIETINGGDTDTDKEEAIIDDDSKTDSNAEDVDVETN